MLNYQTEYVWGGPAKSFEFDKMIKEFNKTHNVELRTWASFRYMTIYVDARRKNARDDKWVMIGSRYISSFLFKKNHVDLKQLTDKNRHEIESFVPVIEQYLN